MNYYPFNPSDFNTKVNALLKRGFEEYLTTVENKVVHTILTNTDTQSKYNGIVVDIYDNGKMYYSSQFKITT